jgi:DDE superfamily endonuclease
MTIAEEWSICEKRIRVCGTNWRSESWTLYKQKMLTLLTGTLLARRRRSITVALRQMGREERPHCSSSQHLLNRARWSPMQLSQCLLGLLVETFVQAGGSVEIVIAETLERRQGVHISKRG